MGWSIYNFYINNHFSLTKMAHFIVYFIDLVLNTGVTVIHAIEETHLLNSISPILQYAIGWNLDKLYSQILTYKHYIRNFLQSLSKHRQ